MPIPEREDQGQVIIEDMDARQLRRFVLDSAVDKQRNKVDQALARLTELSHERGVKEQFEWERIVEENNDLWDYLEGKGKYKR